LLRENVQGRGQRVESLAAEDTTIAGVPAVRLRYAQPGKRAVEYGFVKSGYFFYLLFEAVDGSDYPSELKDFQKVVSTFEVRE
jgi:hypothetical protein